MVYKFEQIAYNLTAKRHPTKDDMKTYIGLEHLESGSLDVREFGSKAEIKGEKLIMTKGDVLLGKRNAYLRRAAIAPHDGLFSAHGMILRPKEDVIDKDYFPFFIASDIFFDEAVRISVGGLSPTINWKDLKVVEFDIPSLDEQKVLADKLWAAYRVKEAYRQLLTTTDDMVKAIFQKMFGEGEYPSKALQEICKTLVAGGDKPSDISEIKSSEYPFPIYSNGEGERGLMGYAKTYKIKDDAITIAARGLVGYTAIRRGKFTPVVRLITIVPNSEINLFYLKYFLDTIEFKATGGAQKQLTIPNVEKEQIIVPPIELQKEFAAVFNQAEATKASLRESIASIDRVIRSLINQ